MADGSVDHKEACQALSALADGELDSRAVAAACTGWRDVAELRDAWHTYHLIGDVLRSDDLASSAARDVRFLQAVRDRLAAEPVILAPAPSGDEPTAVHSEPGLTTVAAAAALRRRTWAAPFAVAAGFMAVAGVLVVTRVAGPTGAPPAAVSLAALQSPGAQRASAPSADDAAEAMALTDARLVRDIHLDRYLAAHKQFGSGATVAVPGVMLRNAASFVPER